MFRPALAPILVQLQARVPHSNPAPSPHSAAESSGPQAQRLARSRQAHTSSSKLACRNHVFQHCRSSSPNATMCEINPRRRCKASPCQLLRTQPSRRSIAAVYFLESTTSSSTRHAPNLTTDRLMTFAILEVHRPVLLLRFGFEIDSVWDFFLFAWESTGFAGGNLNIC